jgi:hypothetical protein
MRDSTFILYLIGLGALWLYCELILRGRRE